MGRDSFGLTRQHFTLQGCEYGCERVSIDALFALFQMGVSLTEEEMVKFCGAVVVLGVSMEHYTSTKFHLNESLRC